MNKPKNQHRITDPAYMSKPFLEVKNSNSLVIKSNMLISSWLREKRKRSIQNKLNKIRTKVICLIARFTPKLTIMYRHRKTEHNLSRINLGSNNNNNSNSKNCLEHLMLLISMKDRTITLCLQHHQATIRDILIFTISPNQDHS